MMSQEDYRRGLQDVLEPRRDQGRLDAIPRSDHQGSSCLNSRTPTWSGLAFLLKHALDDFDWQAFPADIRARCDSLRDARRTRPVRCRDQAAALRAMRSSSFGEATAAAGTLA
jgi:hypothetical protein